MRSNPRHLFFSPQLSSLHIVLYLMIILLGCVVFVVPARYTFIFPPFHVTGKHFDYYFLQMREQGTLSADGASEPEKGNNGTFSFCGL